MCSIYMGVPMVCEVDNIAEGKVFVVYRRRCQC